MACSAWTVQTDPMWWVQRVTYIQEPCLYWKVNLPWGDVRNAGVALRVIWEKGAIKTEDGLSIKQIWHFWLAAAGNTRARRVVQRSDVSIEKEGTRIAGSVAMSSISFLFAECGRPSREKGLYFIHNSITGFSSFPLEPPHGHSGPHHSPPLERKRQHIMFPGIRSRDDIIYYPNIATVSLCITALACPSRIHWASMLKHPACCPFTSKPCFFFTKPIKHMCLLLGDGHNDAAPAQLITAILFAGHASTNSGIHLRKHWHPYVVRLPPASLFFIISQSAAINQIREQMPAFSQQTQGRTKVLIQYNPRWVRRLTKLRN